MITAIGAIVLKNKKILLVKKKETWILPGGKKELNEDNIQCLKREINEELSNTKLKNIKYYKEFFGTSPHNKNKIRAITYFSDIDGKLNNIRKEDTVSKLNWTNNFSKYKISNITMKIIKSLQEDNYL
jgi:ADP-ribose pyrophosphatase YjhB (NUDIX family)